MATPKMGFAATSSPNLTAHRETKLPVFNSLMSIFDDLRDRLVARLEHDGFDVPPRARIEVREALVACLRVAHRSIHPRPRVIHVSNELRARKLVLSPELQASLALVAAEFNNGDDVNQRLTRWHFKADFNDRLRNDLGVCHLHLGPRDSGRDKTRKHRMCGGTNDVLWAIVRELDVYFIELLGHCAFASFDFARVIFDNWAFLLGRPLDGWSIDDSDVLPAELRARARKAGLSSLVSLNGKVFIPGGFMSDGTSLEVVQQANALLNSITDMYGWMNANVERVLRMLERGASGPVDLRFKVGNLESFVRGRVLLEEQHSGAILSVRTRVPT
jgi:hypothetical protein